MLQHLLTGAQCDSVRRRYVRVGWVCGVGTFALLLVTSPIAPMTWDEGDAILRAERVQEWFARLGQSLWKGCQSTDFAELFSGQSIRQGFPFTTSREGHPAFYGLLIALGEAVAPACLDPLTRYRLGPISLFAVATGVCMARVAKIWGNRAAWAAWLALILQPRLFAHVHYASFDGTLTACWLLAWATFPGVRDLPAVSEKRSRWFLGACVWGLALGATMSSKFTGWLAPLPFLFWTCFPKNRGSWRVVAVGLATAGGTFFVLNPALWLEPVAGWVRFFDLNLNRRLNPGLNITTYFLGRLYNLDYPLPWYNSLFWTAVAVPIPILVFFLVGLIGGLRLRRSRGQGLLALHWSVLIVVRALPGVPPHDGIRLFLPAFAFLAILAGVGFRLSHFALRSWLRKRWQPTPLLGSEKNFHPCRGALPRRAPKSSRALFSEIETLLRGVLWTGLLLSALPLYAFAPQWLSYYNVVIGGLPGAVARGMEATYYWDGLDREVFLWLNIRCVPGEKVYFSASSPDNLELQHRWGWLAAAPARSPAEARWYVIQHRPSAWCPVDEWLAQNGQPAFVKYAGRGDSWPLVGNVWVVKVFPVTEFFRASQEVSKLQQQP